METAGGHSSARSVTGRRELALTFAAAVLLGLSRLTLLPVEGFAGTVSVVSLSLMLTTPVLLSIARVFSGVAVLTNGALICALMSVLLAGGMFAYMSGVTGIHDGFAAFRAWPMILCCVALAFAFSCGEDLGRTPVTGVFLGMALWLAILSICALPLFPMPVLEHLAGGPVHFLIGLSTASAAILLLSGSAMSAVNSRSIALTDGLIGTLPLLGFTGTVAGIMSALSVLPEVVRPVAGRDANPEALDALISGLAGAFETTLMGLAATVGLSLLRSVMARQ